MMKCCYSHWRLVGGVLVLFLSLVGAPFVAAFSLQFSTATGTRTKRTGTALAERRWQQQEGSNNGESGTVSSPRRSLLQKIAIMATSSFVGVTMATDAVLVSPAFAAETSTVKGGVAGGGGDESKKPFAPSLDYLLPATRVRVLIDRAVDTTGELVKLLSSTMTETTKSEEKELVVQLNKLLLEKQQFITEPTKSQLPSTWSDWSTARRREREQMLGGGADQQSGGQPQPAVLAAELLERSGERSQWNRLRAAERSREQSNEMRAALNLYTKNLVFGDSYTLRASREERSRLIRTYDQLPDVTSVVRADLDLRDLYRNQMLTSWDDAVAEWKYQTKSKKNGEAAASTVTLEGATEVLNLLKEAQKSCLEWFKFVREDDVKDALDVVLAEQR